MGKLMWEYANGIDNSDVESDYGNPKSISSSVVLPYNYSNIQDIYKILRELSMDVGKRLRKNKLYAGIPALCICSLFGRHRRRSLHCAWPRFYAGYEFCVSNYIARECEIPTFQIEINLKYRLATYKEYEKYKDLIKAIEEIIKLVIDKIN